ncbi:hypothetical protein EON77_08295, partial [bacterium]
MIGEIEVRLERMRSLYSQYFAGIEKLEPLVVRKDFDRRLEVLRKMQIRNTGLRFRFQVVLQRYNTYQTYWLRLCRQIENGTYKRDLRRAQARFGSDLPPPLPLPPEPKLPAIAESPATDDPRAAETRDAKAGKPGAPALPGARPKPDAAAAAAMAKRGALFELEDEFDLDVSLDAERRARARAARAGIGIHSRADPRAERAV